MVKLFSETTAADQQQGGFLYQDFVCLTYLLDLQQEEVVGLEVLDDVSHERINGPKKLIQVKHSVSQGENLTNGDIDFWKTVYNWINVLPEVSKDQIDFIFFTNKSPTNKSGIITQLINDPTDIEALEKHIFKFRDDLDGKASRKAEGDTENPVKKYVDYVCSCSSEDRRLVLSRMKFIFSKDDILQRLRKKIETFGVRECDSEEVLASVIGMYIKKKYELIKEKNKILITYEQFRNEFQFDRTLTLARSREIKFQRYHAFKSANKIDPNSGLFSKQLVDIGISKAEILDYSIEYAATEMFLQQLKSNGDYTDFEEGVFDNELIYGWRNCYQQAYDEEILDEKAHKRVAKGVLRTTIGIDITVSQEKVAKGLVQGKAIELSDKARIGWRMNWQSKYGVPE